MERLDIVHGLPGAVHGRHVIEHEQHAGYGEYDEEEMMKLVSDPFNDDDNNEQISFQNLEILDVLDLNSMFRNESNDIIDKQLEVDELENFIQELDEEDDFDRIVCCHWISSRYCRVARRTDA